MKQKSPAIIKVMLPRLKGTASLFCASNDIYLERQVSYFFSSIFLGNFTPKTSNYCPKNKAFGFPGTEKGRAYNIATHDNHWRVSWEQNNTQLGGSILSDTKYPPIPKGDNIYVL